MVTVGQWVMEVTIKGLGHKRRIIAVLASLSESLLPPLAPIRRQNKLLPT